LKRILVTGGAGFLGSHLCERLVGEGHDVICVDNFFTSQKANVAHLLNKPNFELIRHDIVHPLFLEVDEIYNLAAQSHVKVSFEMPDFTAQVDAVGTIRLLEAIRAAKIKTKFYQASTSELYGSTPPPQSEISQFAPQSPYAAAKLYSYWVVRNYRDAYGLHATNGILFNHESPLRPVRFVTKKIVSTAVRIAQGSHEKLTLGNLNVQRDWGWAPEYVDAMWRILQHDTPDDFVICSGQSHSLKEFVDEVFSYLGLTIGDHLQIRKELYRPSDLSQSLGNPAKAKKSLGWKAKVTFKKLIEELVLAEIKNPSVS
jgi:GDPmannose 4,6-dehydratase